MPAQVNTTHWKRIQVAGHYSYRDYNYGRLNKLSKVTNLCSFSFLNNGSHLGLTQLKSSLKWPQAKIQSLQGNMRCILTCTIHWKWTQVILCQLLIITRQRKSSGFTCLKYWCRNIASPPPPRPTIKAFFFSPACQSINECDYTTGCFFFSVHNLQANLYVYSLTKRRQNQ